MFQYNKIWVIFEKDQIMTLTVDTYNLYATMAHLSEQLKSLI